MRFNERKSYVRGCAHGRTDHQTELDSEAGDANPGLNYTFSEKTIDFIVLPFWAKIELHPSPPQRKALQNGWKRYSYSSSSDDSDELSKKNH